MGSDRSLRRLLLIAPLVLTLAVAACTEENNPASTGDNTAPIAVSNLAADTLTAGSVELTWTAPGDDGSTGTADQYDIRYSSNIINEGNWGTALQVTDEPLPAAAGTAQSFTVTGLLDDSRYYLAIKTADERPNWSAVSNVVLVSTADTTAPAAITTLAADSLTATTVVLEWDAPGDDGETGISAAYDVRYSTAEITAGNFAAATEAAGEPAPTAAGTHQQMTVTGLVPETTYYLAMNASDDGGNASEISNVVQVTTPPLPDVTAPAAIADLAAAALDPTTVELTWTAPGDDGATGTAASYDIRRSGAAITAENWDSATPVPGEPVPAGAGTQQTLVVSNLVVGTDYYFAMRASDEIPNESEISNVVLVHTPTTGVPPGLVVPDFPDTACISSADTSAVGAKLIAQQPLSLIGSYASLATLFFDPLQLADWEQQGDCWTYTYNYSATCVVTYQVCKAGEVYTYTMTMNGDCFGTVYTDFVKYRLVADQGVRTGTFRVYADGTTTIQAAWEWTWAEDTHSGTYTFFSGDPDVTPETARVDWQRTPDLNAYDLTYTVSESFRFVGHFDKQACSGSVTSYQWDGAAPAWWREHEIVWNADGSGTWDTYDQDGTPIVERSW